MVHLQVLLNDDDMVRQIQQAVNSPSITPSVNVIEYGSYVIHLSKIDKQENDTDAKTIIFFQDISDETEKFSFQANILTTTLHRLRKEFETLRGRLQLFSASGSLNQSQALHYKEISRSLDEINAFIQSTSLEERFSTEANLVLRPINIIDVLIQAIRSLKPFADQNKVAVSFSNRIERTDLLVLADQMVIMEAFKHILDNAIRYNTIGGQVSILVTEDESNVAVTIKDTGAGLSALDMARINSDLPLSVTAEGTIKFGTGLRLAKSIFTKHGGKLSVSSLLGEGSTTRITLPKQS
jgi:two-component system, OmpR family, phosphate regulon sensor histidine kinase PhoR